MRNIWKLFFIILCIMLLTNACQKEKSDKEEEPENGVLPVYSEKEAIKKAEEDLYNFKSEESTEFKIDKVEIDKGVEFGGLLVRESDILVADKASDSIVVTDHEGKVLKTVGNTGSAELEFLSPSRMTLYKDEIYVIDQDNFRVQVLTKDLEYVRSIPIKGVDDANPKYRKNHIAVSDEGIFLNGSELTMLGSKRGIELYFSDDGKYRYLATEFSGPITYYDGTLFAINKMVSTPSDMNQRDGSVSSGPNWLFQYNKGEDSVQTVSKLPAGLSISDMLVRDNQIFAFSSSLKSLLQFDKEGKSFIRLITLDFSEKGTEFFLSSDRKDSYWIAVQSTNNLYHIYKEQ